MTFFDRRKWPMAFALLTMTAASPVAAHPVEAGARRCEALPGGDFSKTPDAPFTAVHAEVGSEDAGQPYCRVEGYVAPEIGFEMRLPLSGWNRGFVLVGSGGWAAEKFLFLCKEPLRRGYACIAGDAGHQHGRGLWMQSNPQSKIDWGYRATHATTLAGKALIRAFYGASPALSLMIGTSTGGYQALVEAQRFPWDFAGIVAVAPDIDEAGLAMRTAWSARALKGQDGRTILKAGDLGVLHRAALTACDLTDGVRDGIVGDPLGCRFDPRTAACVDGRAQDCLGPEQVTAARRIYAGPETEEGTRLAAGGLLPGSELGWSMIAEDGFPDEFFRFALADFPGDGLAASDFDFNVDHQRLGLAGTFTSSNPDLRRFRQAGGKLIIVQGGNDTTEQPPVLVDYYETVERVVGGRKAARDFVRLFIVPGMNHASGGDGAFAIDYLSAIERWVSEQHAPDLLVAAHVPEWASGFAGMMAGLTGPIAGQRSTFTRPVYPYPSFAKYDGTGDVDDFRNFGPVESRRVTSP